MNCFYHPQETAVGQCRCGKFLCSSCVEQTSTVICMNCLQEVHDAKVKQLKQHDSQMRKLANRVYAIDNKRFSRFIGVQLILLLISISFFFAADEINLFSRIVISYNFYTFPIMMYHLIKIMIQIRTSKGSKAKPWSSLRAMFQVPAFYLLIAVFIWFAKKQVEWPIIPNFLLNFHLFILPIILGTYFSWARWKKRPMKFSPLQGPPKPSIPKTFYRNQPR